MFVYEDGTPVSPPTVRLMIKTCPEIRAKLLSLAKTEESGDGDEVIAEMTLSATPPPPPPPPEATSSQGSGLTVEEVETEEEETAGTELSADEDSQAEVRDKCQGFVVVRAS